MSSQKKYYYNVIVAWLVFGAGGLTGFWGWWLDWFLGLVASLVLGAGGGRGGNCYCYLCCSIIILSWSAACSSAPPAAAACSPQAETAQSQVERGSKRRQVERGVSEQQFQRTQAELERRLDKSQLSQRRSNAPPGAASVSPMPTPVQYQHLTVLGSIAKHWHSKPILPTNVERKWLRDPKTNKTPKQTKIVMTNPVHHCIG